MTDIEDGSLPGGGQCSPERVFCAYRGILLRRLHCKCQPELRVGVQQRQRTRDELPALRNPRLLARVAPLREREDRERGGKREPHEGAEREQAEPTVATPRLLPCARHRPLGVVPALPAQDGASEHVVEDLPPPTVVRSKDAVTREGLNHG